jgi:hypothetical protein
MHSAQLAHDSKALDTQRSTHTRVPRPATTAAAGGLRPLPDAADLRRFVDSASSMDGLRIAELLRDKMVGAAVASWGAVWYRDAALY